MLQEFGEYLREKADRRFDQQGPGWPALKQATQEQRSAHLKEAKERFRSKAYGTLGQRLRSEQKRVERRLARRERKGDATDRGKSLLLRAVRSAERQRTLRAEFERIKAGGAVAELPKNVKKLAERIGRRDERVQRQVEELKQGKALVGLRPLVVRTEPGVVEVASPIPWSGVHNKGGAAGHGAQIPARPFLYLEQGDLQVLAQMLEAAWAER